MANTDPFAAPAINKPITASATFQPFPTWYAKATAKTMREVWAELRLIPNVHTAKIDDNKNSLIGRLSGRDLTTGTDNILIGWSAGRILTTGSQNILIGSQAGDVLTTGEGDIFIGFNAGLTATIGGGTSQYRTIIGDSAGLLLTSAHAVVLIGRAAGRGMTTDLRSIAIGHAAMFYGGGTTDCVAIGNAAGGNKIDGTEFNYGLLNDTTVTLIGAETGKSSTAARTNNLAIGYRATLPIKDNVAVLGNSSLTDLVTKAKLHTSETRSAVASATGVTLTAAQMLSGWIERTGATSAAFSDTTATGVQLVAGGPGLSALAGVSRKFWYFNDTDDIAQIVAGAGVTTSGNMFVQVGSTAQFVIVFDNTTSGAEAVTLYRVGDDSAINGAAIGGSAINDTTIGATTPSTGAFTTLAASGTTALSGKLTLPSAAYTIATGAITITSARVIVDTEGSAATDDLDTISGGAVNDIIFVSSTSSARTVVLKHATGNINLQGAADFSMSSATYRSVLMFDGSDWKEIARYQG